MPDHQSASWAIEQLEENHASPFLLAVGFMRPHVPFYTQQKWFDLFPIDDLVLPDIPADDLADVPATGRAVNHAANYPSIDWLQANDQHQHKLCVQAYLACVAFVDSQVGRVLDALEKSPYSENTVVVLFSDHGYHLGEKQLVAKHTVWEEASRIPLIIRAPGTATATEVKQSVGLIDIYPTLSELAGIPLPDHLSGDSLVPLLQDPKSSWRDGTLLAWGRGNFSFRTQRYRYIQYHDASEELYDLETDPNSWKNLANLPEWRSGMDRFRNHIPKQLKPLHASTSPKPHNAWFQSYLLENGIR